MQGAQVAADLAQDGPLPVGGRRSVSIRCPAAASMSTKALGNRRSLVSTATTTGAGTPRARARSQHHASSPIPSRAVPAGFGALKIRAVDGKRAR